MSDEAISACRIHWHSLHDITSVREQSGADPKEIDRLLGDKAIVLRLGDDSAKSKLLGIQVDMNYID